MGAQATAKSIPSTWMETVSRDLHERTRIHHIVYVHSAPAFGDLSGLFSGWTCNEYDAEQFALLSEADLQLLTDVGLVLVHGIEVYTRSEGTASSIGDFRAKVHAVQQLGIDVCMVSSRPRSAFPPAPGSSILDDATEYYLPTIPRALIGEDLERVFPAVYEEPKSLLRELFVRSLANVHTDTIIDLERAIFEMEASAGTLVDELSGRSRLELKSVGLACESINGAVVLTLPERASELRLAVGDAIAAVVEAPPDFTQVSGQMFSVERSLRLALRRKSIALYGERWRKSTLIPDINTRVLERARQDAYPLVSSVGQLRDPLEWCTLGELLETVRTKQFDLLGMDDLFWTKFAHDVFPVRNRLAHMRLLNASDAKTVRRWSMLLPKALGI